MNTLCNCGTPWNNDGVCKKYLGEKVKSSVILISGKMGSGKTTIGNVLAERLQVEVPNTYCNNVIFASTIYEMHDQVLKVLEKKGVKRDLVKDGPLLQLLGTEWGRKTIDENVWVKCAQGDVANVMKGYEGKKGYENANVVCIVTDTRFENEFDGFPDALRVRLECPKQVRMMRCEMWRENDTHPSEISLDAYSVKGEFDLYLNTEKQNIHECVDKIIEMFQSDFKGLSGTGYDNVKSILEGYDSSLGFCR